MDSATSRCYAHNQREKARLFFRHWHYVNYAENAEKNELYEIFSHNNPATAFFSPFEVRGNEEYIFYVYRVSFKINRSIRPDES
ncbi:MAG: hypothetical protein CVV41_04585 [Candidatus Riflebacteria bacterium HGW-Riflebacteria-1]|nr:MAG: hypothetical protein CVV41_04585 [Candidatus Riflebacteria bacterium HGW-Riflebacteria-1]